MIAFVLSGGGSLGAMQAGMLDLATPAITTALGAAHLLTRRWCVCMPT
jgi:hypothetical protein